jgi:hypothetical protein
MCGSAVTNQIPWLWSSLVCDLTAMPRLGYQHKALIPN